MGVTIQFESHTIELCAIYLMDHDEEVKEFQEYALPEAQCESMAMEAASGEQELHYTASRRQHLWTILGMSPITEKKEELPPKTGTEAATGEVVKGRGTSTEKTTRRGEQSPRRVP